MAKGKQTRGTVRGSRRRHMSNVQTEFLIKREQRGILPSNKQAVIMATDVESKQTQL